MDTQTTDGITVSVVAVYQPSLSDEAARHYLFSYRIRIANLSSISLQLTDRHWHIWDSTGQRRVVEGPGVVGQQPVLHHGESFEYTSACNLSTAFGSMEGYYRMISTDGATVLNVAIPRFVLEAPSIKN